MDERTGGREPGQMLRAAIFGPESSVIDGKTRSGRRPPFSNRSDELSRSDEHPMKRAIHDRRRRSVVANSCSRLLSDSDVER
ncbi:unnamed protein product [Angiostrongylus costaricensis]|uniref:Uncharacterized protein n=1 Tax=Angiostrongylus costaricensis TaxID=334426 RepID=A0A0R3PKG1_ANGCS|nr:unnamed protein product [Angiostrongylus costaricensis]